LSNGFKLDRLSNGFFTTPYGVQSTMVFIGRAIEGFHNMSAGKRNKSSSKLSQGRALARELYDRDVRALESLSGEEKARLQQTYPQLSKAEFDDVIRQVIEAKTQHQEHVGWQAIPHDIAVLVLVLTTALLDLKTAVIACIATLVLLESVFQFTFNRRLYRPLSALVWFTYPAYLIFAYLLYLQDLEIIWIAVAVLLASIGTYILGALARLPVRLILENSARGRQEGERRRPKK
jgi:hypothetical protein